MTGKRVESKKDEKDQALEQAAEDKERALELRLYQHLRHQGWEASIGQAAAILKFVRDGDAEN